MHNQRKMKYFNFNKIGMHDFMIYFYTVIFALSSLFFNTVTYTNSLRNSFLYDI